VIGAGSVRSIGKVTGVGSANPAGIVVPAGVVIILVEEPLRLLESLGLRGSVIVLEALRLWVALSVLEVLFRLGLRFRWTVIVPSGGGAGSVTGNRCCLIKCGSSWQLCAGWKRSPTAIGWLAGKNLGVVGTAGAGAVTEMEVLLLHSAWFLELYRLEAFLLQSVGWLEKSWCCRYCRWLKVYIYWLI